MADDRQYSIGSEGRKGVRNAPSLINVEQELNLFWDGRATTLENQALRPLLNQAEHGLPSERAIADVVSRDPSYQKEFAAVAGGNTDNKITSRDVARALAAFERTLADGESAFDRFKAGDADAMSPAAKRGWNLFSGSAQCARCHLAGTGKSFFTDHQFHSVSSKSVRIARQLPELTQRVVGLRDGDLETAILEDVQIAELGRFLVTLDPTDIGKFKTPSLRNVALTAPYMHDGSVSTLAEAVDLEAYSRDDESGRPLILTPSERADVVAFLESLTGWVDRIGATRPPNLAPAAGSAAAQ